MTAAERWRRALEAWALPERILASAEESPWIHPPELFEVPEVIAATPSHERAREALRDGDSVLDVGCGGGIAAFALTPPATHVIGVDHQPAMLAMFSANAAARHVECDVVEGFWPDVSARVPIADVVTAHHVVYNVADIVLFLRALDDHARSRVVLELPDHHPLSTMTEAWRHFWQLERPSEPTPRDLMDVLAEMGIAAQHEAWSAPARDTQLDPRRAAHFMRIRLCLPAAREQEVYDYLMATPIKDARSLTTIWWDTVVA